MYGPPTSARRQLIKQVAIYALMTTFVLVMVLILVLVMLGYRFDRNAGTIEQGGLVQLNSIPSGANLMIDGARLSNTTSTKTTLAPGQHTIMMTRDGYVPWQKAVDVKSGRILWLNYARLLPVERPVENIATLSSITSSLQSPNGRWYAITMASPTLQLMDLNNENNPQFQPLTLPESSFTKPEDASTQKFTLVEWDATSRYLLVEHSFDGKIEWIVVDIEDAARTKNVTTLFDITMTKPKFSLSDTQVLFALINGDIRRINIADSTISAPLVRNVTEFSFFDRTTLVYVTGLDSTTKTRSVGYRSENAEKPRDIRTYSDDGVVPLHISIGKYYSQTYVGIAYGGSVEIISGSLPRSDTEDLLSLTAVTTMSIGEPIDYFSNRTDGRFFVAQHGGSYSVYDLELQKATTTTIRSESPIKNELRWLDGYMLWSGFDGTLRFYEFDGTNQNDVMPIIAGQTPALTSNNRFLYAPTVDDKNVMHLSRVRLVLQ